MAGRFRRGHSFAPRMALSVLLLGVSIAPWHASHAAVLLKVGDGSWFEAIQWSPRAVPQPQDDAIIEAPTSIAGSTGAAKLVYLNSSFTLGEDGVLITSSNFHLGTGFDRGGALHIDGNQNTLLYIGNGLLIGSGSSGSVEVNAGTINVRNNLAVGGGPFVNEFALELQTRRSQQPNYEPPDAAGSLTIRGPDAKVFAMGFAVGSEAGFGAQGQTSLRASGTLLVTDGGQLQTGFGSSISLGPGIVSRLGTATVEGTDSLWRTNSMRIDGTLQVADGGHVVSRGVFDIRRNPRRDVAARVDVDGLGSLLEVEQGDLNVNGVMTLQRGGEARVNAMFVQAGEFDDVRAGNVRVGAGSALHVTTKLELYNNLSDSTLLSIEDGVVTAGELTLARGFGNHTNTATLRALGPDARLQVSGATSIGLGTGGVLEVLGGARALLADVGVGQRPSGSGENGLLLVNGEGSLAHASVRWQVGVLEGKGVVTLANAGKLTGQVLNLGGVVASGIDSAGTLNIGSAAGTGPRRAGALDIADDINIGQSGLVVFNHLDSAYQFDTRLESTVFRAGRVEQRAGTTVLTSDQSAYTGAMHVMGGTLIVNGSLGSPQVEVDAGATLGGSGAVNDILAHDGAIISPGNSPGVLTVTGDLVMQPGAVLRLEVLGDVPGTQHDVIEVAGDASLNGAIIELVFGNGFAPRANQSLGLLDIGGQLAGVPTVQFTGLEDGWLYDLDFDPFLGKLMLTSLNDGIATTQPNPVPLPGTLVLLATALTGLGVRTRRRRCCPMHAASRARDADRGDARRH